MKLTNLKDYVEKEKQWYIDKYGKLDWHWHEGIVWLIQDYLSMMGEFSEEDLICLKELDFVPEDFIEKDENE